MSGLTDSFYDRWARLYDRVATAPGVRSWRDWAVRSLALEAGDTVLEPGCGTGANFPCLRRAVGRAGTVIGVDLVGAMLDRARARATDAGWRNVHVVRADATRPPVGGVDAVLATFLIGMLSNPAAAVRTWLRQTTAGGRITLVNAGRTDRPLAKPVNPLFRLFVRLAAPGARRRRASPARTLEQRWTTARDALFAATERTIEWRLGGGFVRLASGRVPG